MTPQEIIACVHQIDECSAQAIWWIRRRIVCCVECRHKAINEATVHAREAAHAAQRLIRLSEAVARTEGTHAQLFDPQEFERRVAFMEGRKR